MYRASRRRRADGACRTHYLDELCGTVRALAIDPIAPSTLYPGVPSGSEVSIALIIEAVNSTLNGCVLVGIVS